MPVGKILKKLEPCGLFANKIKTAYKQKKVDYLVHTISFNKIEQNLKEMQTTDDSGTPSDKKQPEELPRKINYHRKNVKN